MIKIINIPDKITLKEFFTTGGRSDQDFINQYLENHKSYQFLQYNFVEYWSPSGTTRMSFFIVQTDD